mgnify:CR=1 FL=1
MGTNILVGFPILSWSDRKMIQHYSTNTLVYYCKWWCMYGSAGPKLVWSLGIDTCRWDLQEYWYQFLLYTLLYWLSVGWYFGLIYFICITDIGQDFKKLWSWLYLIGLLTFGKYLQCENLRYQYYITNLLRIGPALMYDEAGISDIFDAVMPLQLQSIWSLWTKIKLLVK